MVILGSNLVSTHIENQLYNLVDGLRIFPYLIYAPSWPPYDGKESQNMLPVSQ